MSLTPHLNQRAMCSHGVQQVTSTAFQDKIKDLNNNKTCFSIKLIKINQPTPPSLALSLSIYLYLFAGDITQKGYEKKRLKLIRAFVPHAGGNLATSDLPHTHIPIPPRGDRSGIMTNTVAMILHSIDSVFSRRH